MTNIIENNGSKELLQLVSFELNKEEYAIEIIIVQEIIRMVQITKIPNSPDFVVGVINIRGRIIPVIDLRSKLGMPKKEHDKDTRVMIVDLGGQITGFIVDRVTEVLRIPASITETCPEIVAGVDSDFIQSVGKLDDRLLILINLPKLLTQFEKYELVKVA